MDAFDTGRNPLAVHGVAGHRVDHRVDVVVGFAKKLGVSPLVVDFQQAVLLAEDQLGWLEVRVPQFDVVKDVFVQNVGEDPADTGVGVSHHFFWDVPACPTATGCRTAYRLFGIDGHIVGDNTVAAAARPRRRHLAPKFLNGRIPGAVQHRVAARLDRLSHDLLRKHGRLFMGVSGGTRVAFLGEHLVFR